MEWWSWWVRWTGVGGPSDGRVHRTPDVGPPVPLALVEFRARIAEEYPELPVDADAEGVLRIHRTIDDDRPIVVNVARMAARLPDPSTRNQREAAYDIWIQVLGTILEARPVDATWGARLLPRLVTPGWLVGSPDGPELVAREVEGLGLYCALVFDFPESVRFVTPEDLERLGMDAAEAHARAHENFRGRLPADVVREQLRDPKVTTFHAIDSYEAARILLLPELLEPGEAVGAAIPDRDSLVLFPVESSIEMGRALAAGDGPDVLLDRPVRVTREGFELL